jgi:hypothetical protein
VHHLHEREVRPAAESRPGSLGLSLLASPEAGAAVLESFWASRDALAETTGFRSALLFADPGSGHLISESVWWDARRGQQARASPLLRPVRTAYEAPAADPNLIPIV